jgi:hypothetical protein
MRALPTQVNDTNVTRRLLHLALLVLVIVGVRACGGATQAEDRVNVASRWVAEKTGLSQVRDTWNARFRPRIAGASESVSGAIYQTFLVGIRGVQNAIDGVVAWMAERTRTVMDAVAGTLRSVLTRSPTPQPGRAPDPSAPQPGQQPAPAP